MKHEMIPAKNPNVAIDRNDPEHAKTAIELEWPETFSTRAKMVIKYFEGTMFPFLYNGHIVVTDESLELTAFGDGSPEAPFGFPRYEDNDLRGVELWLEDCADQFDNDGDTPGWEEVKAAFEVTHPGQGSKLEGRGEERLEGREEELGDALGSFEVVSGRLAISDPCYDPDVWCRGELENCMLGTWLASVVEKNTGSWGRRICKLIAVHSDYARTPGLIRETAGFEVGVDSGQAGIFDAAHYQDASVVPDDGHPHLFEGAEADPWYDYCCDITLGDKSAGVLPYGCVSSSGFGDGFYDCFFWRNTEGQIVRVEIEFVTSDDDSDSD